MVSLILFLVSLVAMFEDFTSLTIFVSPTATAHLSTHTLDYPYTHPHYPPHTCISVVKVGRHTHSRVHTDELRSGPSSRRGKYVVKSGRCVQCLTIAPVPEKGRKTKMSNRKYIPCV